MYKSYHFSFLHYVHVGSFTTPAAEVAPLRIFVVFVTLSRRSYVLCKVAVCRSPPTHTHTHISHYDVTRIAIHIFRNCCRINCGVSLNVARIGVEFASSKP